MEILKVGPLGRDNKHEIHWEETCTDPISHIFVTFNTVYVTSIQFGSVKNGALVMSKKYGSQTGRSTRIVRLNHESEFVTGISGEAYCRYFSSAINGPSYCCDSFSSLTMHTNERNHDAFQAELTPPSRSIAEKIELHLGIHDRREFGGFFGSCYSDCLSSIGLYLKPILSGVGTIKQENV